MVSYNNEGLMDYDTIVDIFKYQSTQLDDKVYEYLYFNSMKTNNYAIVILLSNVFLLYCIFIIFPF